MIAWLSEKVSSFFVEKNIIKDEDDEIYCYSFEVLFSTVINFMMVILIAIVTKSILVSSFYLLGFLPLRATAGGYHASTHLRCILILLATYVIFLVILAVLPSDYILPSEIIICTLSFILVFALSPVEDKNKPLSEKETQVFKAKSRLCIVIYTFIVFILFFALENKWLSLSLALGNISVSLSLLASRIKSMNMNKLKMPEGH